MDDELRPTYFDLARDAGMGQTFTLNRPGAEVHDVFLLPRTGEMVRVKQVDGTLVAVERGVRRTVVVSARRSDEVLRLGNWPDEAEVG